MADLFIELEHKASAKKVHRLICISPGQRDSEGSAVFYRQ
jgi:hypothetical protein